MTPVFAARRRAEQFDSLVERRSTGADDTAYAEFLDIVAALRSVPEPEPRPEFVRDLRQQLMLAADTLLVPSTSDAKLTLPARKPVRERRLAAAVGGFAIVGATTSMAMAAQSALPGDVLYPLKRAIENAEAGISVNDAQRGSTLLANASGRLAEVSALSRAGGDGESPVIADTLNTFTEQSIEAADLLLVDYEETGDESSIIELRDFTGDSMQTLAELEALIPAGARDELLHAAGVLTQIDAEAYLACPNCGGSGITDIPKILISSSGFADDHARSTSGVGSEAVSSGDEKAKPGETQASSAEDGPALAPSSVLGPSQGSGGEDTGGTPSGGSEQQQDPIASLTEGLTGGGDSQPVSNQPGLPGEPEVDDVTDAVDEVTNPLTGGDTSGDGKQN